MAHLPVRRMIIGFAVIAGLYVAALSLLYTFQRSLQYFPDARQIPPEAAGYTAEEFALATIDGETVYAWWRAPGNNRPVIVHFHGNGGGMAYRADRYRLFTDVGYGLLAMTYRGYSGSTGSPSEAALVQDAELSLEFLKDKDVSLERVVLYGESLGTGVAVQLAAKADILAVILEAPFTSAWAVAKSVYPIFPVRLLMKDKFESDQFISKVAAPLLVIHGRQDNVIPFRFGQELFELANEPKKFVALANAGHNDLYDHGTGEAVLAFLDGLKN